MSSAKAKLLSAVAEARPATRTNGLSDFFMSHLLCSDWMVSMIQSYQENKEQLWSKWGKRGLDAGGEPDGRALGRCGPLGSG